MYNQEICDSTPITLSVIYIYITQSCNAQIDNKTLLCCNKIYT